MTEPDPEVVELAEKVVSVLSDELRRPPWRGSPNPVAGHCYVASEALFHLLGGRTGPWRPTGLIHEGSQHWWLRNLETGAVLDPTADQFETPVPYADGRGRTFLTREPSKRARIVLSRLDRS